MNRRLPLAATAVALVISAAALAQAPAPSGNRPAPPPPADNPVAGQNPIEALRGEGATRGRLAQGTAHALIGRDAEGRDGKELGEVVDVITDNRTGAVDSLIVKVGEIKGLERLKDRTVEVPFQRVIIQPSAETVVLNMPPEDLANLKEWAYNTEGEGMVGVGEPIPTAPPSPAPPGSQNRPKPVEGTTGR